MESGNETTDIEASMESIHRSQSENLDESPKASQENLDKADTYPKQGTNIQRELSVKSKSVVKQGHLRIKEDGQKVYKKTPSQAIMLATQLGIGFSVGRLSAKPERDVLMQDFYFVEKVWFPAEGSKETPSHKFNDFRFKTYAPVAFRYFRDLFEILPSDFLISLSNEPLREISNPGASGSLFFVSNDDMFIVKTVQHKEATFLQQLLSGYYMNLHQNPRTLLPKFFGLYCYQSGTSNIRLTVMNNLLPSKYKCHMKFDLKGSTYKRKASKAEKAKASPTYKDLDFLQLFPNGITLDIETYDAIIKTISRDVRVLESFSIMDYSFLLGIHNIDQKNRERGMNSPSRDKARHNPEREARKNEFSAKLEAIQLSKETEDEEIRPVGCIPAKNDKGERLYLFIGIIDILQSYRLAKKMEHGFKSLLTDGDTVSVHKPSFYAKRFLDFIKDKVFKRSTIQRVPTKRRSVRNSANDGKERNSSSVTDEPIVRKESLPTSSTILDTEVKPRVKNKSVTIKEPGEEEGTSTDQQRTDNVDAGNRTTSGVSGTDNSIRDVDDVNISVKTVEQQTIIVVAPTKEGQQQSLAENNITKATAKETVAMRVLNSDQNQQSAAQQSSSIPTITIQAKIENSNGGADQQTDQV